MYPTLIEMQARQHELERQFNDPRHAALREHIRAARVRADADRPIEQMSRLGGRWRRVLVLASR